MLVHAIPSSKWNERGVLWKAWGVFRRSSEKIPWVVTLVILSLGTGCFGEDPNLTESGLGRPYVTVEFPETVEPGTTHDARVTIENPGPGDMDSVVVAFLRVGPAQGGEPLPVPLVDAGARGGNPAIVAIEPEPRGTSPDAVVFTFGQLPERESTTITFSLKIPDVTGPAANSVQAYAGEDPSRARGARLETDIQD